MNLIEKLIKDESGQDMAEYAIALAVIAATAVTAFKLIGTNVTTVVNRVATSIQ